MTNLTQQQIIDILDNIILPGKNISVIEAKIISEIIIKDYEISFAIEINNEIEKDLSQLVESCKSALLPLGASRINIILTKENKIPIREKYNMPNVKKIIAIASGKGGVGKSTLAVNLAIIANEENLKIGLLDLDINGPSIPYLLDIQKKPALKDGKIIPIEKFGIKTLSMGYMVDQNQATIWRGPMYGKALSQMIMGANWSELDILFIDVPPGTGDIHLNLTENYQIDGVILVSTPSDLALIDVAKALNMYEKLNTPIIGIVENMSYYINDLGNKEYIFGKNKVKEFASDRSLKFLGEVPLLREFSSKAKLSQDTALYYKNIFNNIRE